jgi:hypothetical protein
LKERSFAGADQGKEVVGELFGERLLSARRPNRVIPELRKGFKLGQCGVHSGNIAIGW